MKGVWAGLWPDAGPLDRLALPHWCVHWFVAGLAGFAPRQPQTRLRAQEIDDFHTEFSPGKQRGKRGRGRVRARRPARLGRKETRGWDSSNRHGWRGCWMVRLALGPALDPCAIVISVLLCIARCLRCFNPLEAELKIYQRGCRYHVVRGSLS